jgi:hypothetical protein
MERHSVNGRLTTNRAIPEPSRPRPIKMYIGLKVLHPSQPEAPDSKAVLATAHIGHKARPQTLPQFGG